MEASEVMNLASHSNIKILDFRKEEDYHSEHIPNALHIWRSDIEDSSYAYQGIMPTRAQVEALFSERGIHSKDTLVLYDDNGLCNAARLWWILQNYDFDQVKLMQGGLEGWKKAGGKTTTELPMITKSEFKLSQNPSMKFYVSLEEMKAVINDSILILDTRSAEEFSGELMKSGASRAGRIPGSIHLDWAEAVDYSNDQHLKSESELAAIYNRLQVDKNRPIIVYCHSGVRSAHTTFVLTQILGYANVKNYDGSWTEWSYFKELPIEKDF